MASNLARWCAFLAVLVVMGLGSPRATAQAAHVLNSFDEPYAYAFRDWKGKAEIASGRLLLHTLDCGGGIGVKGRCDVQAFADLTPVLRLRIGKNNTAQSMLLKLMDTQDRVAVWTFDLPDPSDEWLDLPARGGAALTTPHEAKRVEGESLDLSDIVHYQLLGDWSKGQLDAEIDAILLAEPDQAVLAAMETLRAQRSAAEQIAPSPIDPAERKAQQQRERLAAYAQRTERSPRVTHVCLVGPDVLSLTIDAQQVVRSSVQRYEPQPRDRRIAEKRRDGTVRCYRLLREGQVIGRILDKDKQWYTTLERIEGDPLLAELADNPAHYTVRSDDDSACRGGVQPTAIYRKSEPSNVALPGGPHSVRHRVYLKLPVPIREGKHYQVAIDKLNVQEGSLNFAADLRRVRSESVHVNQIGYRPDDPLKRAYLSVWLGTGGAYSFEEPLRFEVLDDASGAVCYSGRVQRVMAADGQEKLWTKPPKNYSQTAVYRMDFDDFDMPGRYRLYVEGVGCSYPFTLGDEPWGKAFLTQMKGLYNQRSGVELGPPYTTFKRPRDFHPDDGLIVTRTGYDVMTNDAYITQNFAKGDTGEPVADAWGGYHDAGDWNPRRVTHMRTTLAQLELCELMPEYFLGLDLNIPSTPGVPDMITEALFEIDCFRRLQGEDGGVPYGIETANDPLPGEISWLSMQQCYVPPPDMLSSWLYAAVAARAAKLLQPIKPELAEVYRRSAAGAFAWAERNYAQRQHEPGFIEAASETLWEAMDAHNLSALILYEVTGQAAYHDVFLDSTCLKQPGQELVSWGLRIQSDAAFLYARMDEHLTDPSVRKNAVDGIVGLAERSLDYAAGNAFGLTNREPGRPLFAGFFSTPGGVELVRAHYLTGERRYLAGAVQSCLFALGCNPNNLVYTTGLGSERVQNPLEVDARVSGQAVPIGLTVFGNSDYFNWRRSFWDTNLKYVNKPENLWPDAYDWPLTEAYFDTWVLVSANEYVIDTWGPNVLVWGYLAARK